jgi:hypothetical protein
MTTCIGISLGTNSAFLDVSSLHLRGTRRLKRNKAYTPSFEAALRTDSVFG